MKLEWGKAKAASSFGHVESRWAGWCLRLAEGIFERRLHGKVCLSWPRGLRTDASALKLAQVKLPVPSEFITASSPPRLGALADDSLAPPPSALPVPARLVELDAKDEGGARDATLQREAHGAELLADSATGVSFTRPQDTA